MVLLRRVIGDALRGRRQRQHKTLREVSTTANVSLGYLSEIERGQKEASSELLSSICDALGAQLSEVLREVSDTLALAEQLDGIDSGTPVKTVGPRSVVPARRSVEDSRRSASADANRRTSKVRVSTPDTRVVDGQVSVTVRHDSPLRTTLKATRSRRPEMLRS